MNIILSAWSFTINYVEILPGLQIGITFDVLTFLMGTLAVYQDTLKYEDFEPISLSILTFNPEMTP